MALPRAPVTQKGTESIFCGPTKWAPCCRCGLLITHHLIADSGRRKSCSLKMAYTANLCVDERIVCKSIEFTWIISSWNDDKYFRNFYKVQASNAFNQHRYWDTCSSSLFAWFNRHKRITDLRHLPSPIASILPLSTRNFMFGADFDFSQHKARNIFYVFTHHKNQFSIQSLSAEHCSASVYTRIRWLSRKTSNQKPDFDARMEWMEKTFLERMNCTRTIRNEKVFTIFCITLNSNASYMLKMLCYCSYDGNESDLKMTNSTRSNVNKDCFVHGWRWIRWDKRYENFSFRKWSNEKCSSEEWNFVLMQL